MPDQGCLKLGGGHLLVDGGGVAGGLGDEVGTGQCHVIQLFAICQRGFVGLCPRLRLVFGCFHLLLGGNGCVGCLQCRLAGRLGHVEVSARAQILNQLALRFGEAAYLAFSVHGGSAEGLHVGFPLAGVVSAGNKAGLGPGLFFVLFADGCHTRINVGLGGFGFGALADGLRDFALHLDLFVQVLGTVFVPLHAGLHLAGLLGLVVSSRAQQALV